MDDGIVDEVLEIVILFGWGILDSLTTREVFEIALKIEWGSGDWYQHGRGIGDWGSDRWGIWVTYICKWGIKDEVFSRWGITDRVYFLAIRWGCEQGIIKSLSRRKTSHTKDATVPLLGQVFWIKSFVVRHWERVKVYNKAFSSFPLSNMMLSSLNRSNSYALLNTVYWNNMVPPKSFPKLMPKALSAC